AGDCRVRRIRLVGAGDATAGPLASSCPTVLPEVNSIRVSAFIFVIWFVRGPCGYRLFLGFLLFLQFVVLIPFIQAAARTPLGIVATTPICEISYLIGQRLPGKSLLVIFPVEEIMHGSNCSCWLFLHQPMA